MKFKVTRTSMWWGGKPCEEATPINEGQKTEWEVKISTIDDLSAFVEKYGKVVIGRGWIEIYDSYRE